jgi:hypothetical protein
MNNLIVIPLTPREQDINNIIFNNVGNVSSPQNQIGAFIGNGKIGLFTDFNHINTQKTVISTDIKYSDGRYKSNIIETFNTSKVMFFNEYINDNVTETMIQQNLNISYSTFTSELEIRKNTGAQVNVNTDIYCPYQMPYMTILTLDIIPIRADDINEEVMNIPIIHEVYTKGNIIDITYNNNYIYIEGYGSVHILSGTGKDINNKNKDIAFACGYIFDKQVDNLGFNILKNDSDYSAINRFQIPNAALNSNIKMTILSAHMTSHDFENPIEELKHMIISAVTKVNNIRAKHLVEWGSKWDTNINIVPKTGITSDLKNDILALNQIIRMAIYNVYSCTRENINTEINPFNLHLIDTEGILMYEGDIWFLPLLCILKPDIARSILEERYNTLNMARQISNGYGYSGAKFPYNTDIIGYRNLIYYDTKGSVSVFNNALISINVWNYYRVTRDKEWLQNKGYPIMKDISNFFVSLITVENNKYSLDNVYSLSNNSEQSNNSFTNNMVKLSLKYVIEASYELNIKPSEKFIKYMNGLEIKIINPEDFNDVIGINDNTPENTESFDILDILFILMPFYSDIYFDQGIINRGNNSLKRNLDYYINKINTKFVDHPYNDALLAIVYGMYAQSDENYVHTFDYFLHKFIERNIVYNNDSGSVNAWLNMKAFGTNTYNSLISNAMLVLVILFGICQTNIEGGITPSKFYYEEMKVNMLNTANMPCHWDRISINNIGSHNNLKSFIVKNRILFTTLESCSNPAPL